MLILFQTIDLSAAAPRGGTRRCARGSEASREDSRPAQHLKVSNGGHGTSVSRMCTRTEQRSMRVPVCSRSNGANKWWRINRCNNMWRVTNRENVHVKLACTCRSWKARNPGRSAPSTAVSYATATSPSRTESLGRVGGRWVG